MNRHIGQIALVVRDYDEAITFYTEKLNFTLFEDTALSETKRHKKAPVTWSSSVVEMQ